MRHVPDDANALGAFRAATNAVTGHALVVADVSLALLLAWDSPRLKASVPGRLPGPLVVVVWAIAYHAFTSLVDPASALADHQRVTLPAVDGPMALLSQLRSPDWSALMRPELYSIATTLAVVASLETLLSLEASDKLDPLKRVAPPNRELQAQGVGNIVAGLLGGLPLTAVIVRTSANIQAGARSPMSAVLHGVLLLASVLFLASALSWLPLAALSAILLHTGYKLARPSLLLAAWKQGRASFVPFVVTLGAIMATDLLVGILVGLACSMLFVIHANTRGALSITSRGDAHLLQLTKDVSFFSKATLRRYLGRVEPGHSLIIDGSRCVFLDRDIREALDNFAAHAAGRGIAIELRSMPVRPTAPGLRPAG